MNEKQSLWLIPVLTVMIAILPLTSLIKGDLSQNISNKSPASGDSLDISKDTDNKYFFVFDTETETISVLSNYDYICGVVAAEMPLSYHEEALKAQAVAAYTYADRQRSISRSEGNDYDITTSPSINQSYITVSEMKKKWGKDFDKYYSKLKNVVSSVEGQRILYDGEPILAAYHAISSGITESSEVVWGVSCEYLTPVDSSGDKDEKKYLSTVSLTPDELKNKISKKWDNISFPGTEDAWINITECSSSGTVISVHVGNLEISGVSLKNALGLRSSVFECEYKDNLFTFTVKGFGHGVGMSQTGANSMAEGGSTYTEILTHYYKNTEIK